MIYVLEDPDLAGRALWSAVIRSCIDFAQDELLTRRESDLWSHRIKQWDRAINHWSISSEPAQTAVIESAADKIALFVGRARNETLSFDQLLRLVEQIYAMGDSGIFNGHGYAGADYSMNPTGWEFIGCAVANVVPDVARDTDILYRWRKTYLGESHQETQTAKAWRVAAAALPTLFDQTVDQRPYMQPDLRDLDLLPSWPLVTSNKPPGDLLMM